MHTRIPCHYIPQPPPPLTPLPTDLRAEFAEAIVPAEGQDAVLLVVMVAVLVSPVVRVGRGGGVLDLVGVHRVQASAGVVAARTLHIAHASAVPVQVAFITAPALCEAKVL